MDIFKAQPCHRGSKAVFSLQHVLAYLPLEELNFLEERSPLKLGPDQQWMTRKDTTTKAVTVQSGKVTF